MGIGKKGGGTATKAPRVRRKREAEQLLGIQAVEVRDVPVPPPRTWGTATGADQRRAVIAELRCYVDAYYAIQGTRIGMANRVGGLVRDAGMPAERAEAFSDYLTARVERIEAELRAAIGNIVIDHPLYAKWLRQVRGGGAIIAGGWIAYACGPHYHALRDEAEAQALAAQGRAVVKRALEMGGRPGARPWEAEEGEADENVATAWYEVTEGFATWPTVSKFWTAIGLGLRPDGTIQRRIKGERGNWSPALKVHAWKCASVLVLANGRYADLYRQTKARLAAREPRVETLTAPDPVLLGRTLIDAVAGLEAGRMVTKPTLLRLRRDLGPTGQVRLGWRKGHIDAQARRWLAKLFAAHVWQVMREEDGLPCPPPYAMSFGPHEREHQTLIGPVRDKEVATE